MPEFNKTTKGTNETTSITTSSQQHFEAFSKCTTAQASVHKELVDNKFLHSNIISQSNDTFSYDQIKTVLVHASDQRQIDDLNCDLVKLHQRTTVITTDNSSSTIEFVNNNFQLVNHSELIVDNLERMKEPTIIVQHHQQQTHSTMATSHAGVVRKSSPDLNNNGGTTSTSSISGSGSIVSSVPAHQQHTSYSSYFPTSMIDDYVYMYPAHTSAIPIATSSSSASGNGNSVQSTTCTTSATTIDEVIADTLKDEHNASNGAGSTGSANSTHNSGEDETAQYLSLTTANDLPDRWVSCLMLAILFLVFPIQTCKLRRDRTNSSLWDERKDEIILFIY